MKILDNWVILSCSGIKEIVEWYISFQCSWWGISLSFAHVKSEKCIVYIVKSHWIQLCVVFADVCVCLYVYLCVCLCVWLDKLRCGSFSAFEDESRQAKHQHRPNQSWGESTQLYQWHLLLAHMMNVSTARIPIEICQEESCQWISSNFLLSAFISVFLLN